MKNTLKMNQIIVILYINKNFNNFIHTVKFLKLKTFNRYIPELVIKSNFELKENLKSIFIKIIFKVNCFLT